MTTSEIIKNIRTNCNLTQDEMAQKLFVTRQAVSRWENGDTIPNIETLRLMSRIFDVSINVLVDTAQNADNGAAEINADRFKGFADVYDLARPTVPLQVVSLVDKYLCRFPETVVDLGCGTGLSTMIWKGNCQRAIGIDPSDDMLSVAKEKTCDEISFKKEYSHSTGLPDSCADVVICSQSFHWMNPQDTLSEANRILKSGGIFATVDCDWPPVCGLRAEIAYSTLFNKVRIIEAENKEVCETFCRWDKSKHLKNISDSGYFRYCREIVFNNEESCNAERFLGLAQSQGSLQTILRLQPELIEKDYLHFQKEVYNSFSSDNQSIIFCYRMRMGIK